MGIKIAVASGKGGTGKTTVSVNLAHALGVPVQLIDCDVEEPNSRLFLDAVEVAEEVVNIQVPSVDEGLCDGCGKCRDICQFSSIVVFGSKPLLFPEMCHGCGGCTRICPQKAIIEIEKRIGTIKTFRSNEITLLQGCIDVGVAMAPPLINELKKKVSEKDIVILDAPPGTTCPVIATLGGVDYVVLVTEPTPFGLNDLKLAVEMVREIGIPFGVVINRVGVGDDRVQEYCRAENINILLEINNDRLIAEAYSRGELIVQALPEYKEKFAGLLESIKRHLPGNEG